MNKNISPQIMDKLTKVCVCRSITRATVKKAIQNGAESVDEVQKTTGAGSGSCGGTQCILKIQMLLEEMFQKKGAFHE